MEWPFKKVLDGRWLCSHWQCTTACAVLNTGYAGYMTYIMIAILVKFNAKQRAKVTINTTLQSSLGAWLVTLDVWENQLESFPGRKQPAVHVWLNNTATCVLLFFLNPLRALQPESWTSHCLMFDFNLQRVTRFARRLQGCELPFRVQLESLQCVYSLLVLLLKPSWNCCSPDLFVTFFLLYLFMHFSISLFFFFFLLVVRLCSPSIPK